VVGYIVRRVAQSVVILLGLTLVTFLLLHAIPGGQARGILGPRARPVQLQHFVHENGLDRPILDQYFTYLNQLLHWNFGYSYKLNQTVNAVFAQDLPKSAALLGPPTLLALVIAMVIGMRQALRPYSFEDHAITGVSYVLYAMPDFWLALVLIDVFAIRFGWLPPVGPVGTSWTAAFTDAKAMVLPWTTLTLVSVAGYSRYMRSSGLDVLGQDYIRTARAKGASKSRVIRKHVIRNACLPMITLLGLTLPSILSGAFIEEFVFNYPGIGLASVNAAYVKDYPVMLGTTIVFGALTIFGNLVADIAYAFADPRVRIT
jgi:peptide/nickel transport system permease protein